MKNFKSQISNFKLLLVAILGVALSSCNMLPEQPEYRLSDLQALWLENGDTVVGHHVRFTTEQSDETGYLYGREWNDNEWYDEGSYEEFLIEQRERQGYPGNGWFKYQFETKGNLTEIHLMDNGGAEIPKVYVVSKLTSTELQYYEKDHKNIKFSFSKVVTAK